MVRPEWITHSASLGTLLPWTNFIFRSEDRAGAIQGTKAAQKSLFQNFTTVRSSPRTITSLSNEAEPIASGSSTKSTLSFSDESGPLNAESLEDEKDEMDGLYMDADLHSTPPTPPPAQPRPHPPQKLQDVPLDSEPSEPSQFQHIPDQPVPDINPPARPGYAVHDSNPHARRAMQDPNWRAAHTSVAPDYVEKYYQNSRLHHLSTWKAELKNLVAEALAKAENAIGEVIDQAVVMSDEETTRDVPMGVSMRGAELIVRSPGKQSTAARPARFQSYNTDAKVIMHVDFDAFFVSAGLVSRPQLYGKPVVVCHSQGSQGSDASTSEIASASYEARAFGVKNGMRYADQYLVE